MVLPSSLRVVLIILPSVEGRSLLLHTNASAHSFAETGYAEIRGTAGVYSDVFHLGFYLFGNSICHRQHASAPNGGVTICDSGHVVI